MATCGPMRVWMTTSRKTSRPITWSRRTSKRISCGAMKVSQKRPSAPVALRAGGEPTGSSTSASAPKSASQSSRWCAATHSGERATSAKSSCGEADMATL